MLDQVRATIRKYCMFAPADRVLVGVSGGPDSVALVHVLKALAGELQLQLFIAHLNHCFRGKESEEDADFVCRLAEDLGLPAQVESRDVAGYAEESNLSAQAAAREVRYRFFQDAAEKFNCSKLATGHNANDQAETVLLHFLRGSGLAGLGGIPPVRDTWVVRPLIEIHRSEIEKYCTDNGLSSRLDRSNMKTVYTRNRLRLELMPLLQAEYNSNLVETLVRTGEIMRKEEKFLTELTERMYEQLSPDRKDGEISFNLDEFSKLPEAMQARIIRSAWGKLTGTGHNLGFVHISAALDILRCGQTGSTLNLPMGVSVSKSYKKFSLLVSTFRGEVEDFQHELIIPGLTYIPETGETISAELVDEGTNALPEKLQADEAMIDLDKVSLPLTVRNRKQGEVFRPIGCGGSKKLKKFLIDSKVLRFERDRLPILVTADDQVVWIAGLRADQRWLITPETKRALKLKLIRNKLKQN